MIRFRIKNLVVVFDSGIDTVEEGINDLEVGFVVV